jgi:hypothetical protein
VEHREAYEDDRTLLCTVLFDIRGLLARLVELVESGRALGEPREGKTPRSLTSSSSAAKVPGL